MKYTYETTGVCARKIEFELDENIVKNIKFAGGCAGNSQGVAILAEGMDKTEVIKRLEGVNCGGRGTSCPDQLAQALERVEQNQGSSYILSNREGPLDLYLHLSDVYTTSSNNFKRMI